MILLLSVTEADCLGRQHRRVTGATNRRQRARSAYRASGLVRRPIRDIRTFEFVAAKLSFNIEQECGMLTLSVI